jgi:hypothetical protein
MKSIQYEQAFKLQLHKYKYNMEHISEATMHGLSICDL